MSTLYIVAGLPGTGKTTLSEYLQEELGVPLFCKDKMKEILFDVVGFQSPQGKEQLDRASTEILYYDAHRCLKAGGDAMIESNFKACDLPDVEKLAGEFGCRCVTLYLTGDLRVIFDRLCARNHAPDRHPAHAIDDHYPLLPGESDPATILEDWDEFEAMVKSWEVEKFHLGPVVTVDTTDFSKVDFPSVLAELRACLQ
ncbi:AAA family ATPase [Bittarella massiliensis (ex Durand et al. 2017)]|uniref:AAA family ATPase n=1 Tax=Bittarella massiliensis (ex Durand et al. 2017) TaxID=1720313 RepID=UPI00073F57AA|nr:AAA family ATPase [Bittarella massiliensis (ex Durand et al. 2017)]